VTSAIGVGDLAQLREDAPQVLHIPRSEMRGPLRFDFIDYGGPDLDSCLATWTDPDQLGPPIRGVSGPYHVPGLLELLDKETRGLLGHLSLLGQVDDPGSLRADPGKDPSLGDRDVIETFLSETFEDPLFESPIGDEQQQPDV
jgi:hypothetical protein